MKRKLIVVYTGPTKISDDKATGFYLPRSKRRLILNLCTHTHNDVHTHTHTCMCAITHIE